MKPPDKLPKRELWKLLHAQRVDFTADMVGELLAELELLQLANNVLRARLSAKNRKRGDK